MPEGRDARVAPVGQLIAAQRRRRGLSQAVLAGLVGRTEGWLSKVERGEIEIDRISVLLQIAEVLRVPASTLMPGTLPEPSDVEHSAALHLRLALSGHDILVAMFSDPVQRATPEPWEDLDIELSTCWRLVHAAEYVGLGERLPRLISSLEPCMYSTTFCRPWKTARGGKWRVKRVRVLSRFFLPIFFSRVSSVRP